MKKLMMFAVVLALTASFVSAADNTCPKEKEQGFLQLFLLLPIQAS